MSRSGVREICKSDLWCKDQWAEVKKQNIALQTLVFRECPLEPLFPAKECYNWISNCCENSRSQLFVTYDVLDNKNYFLQRKLFGNKKLSWYKSRRTMQSFLLASAEDGVAVNGGSQSRPSDDVEEMRAKLSGSLQDEYSCGELIQSLHDAARTFELALKAKISSSRLPWFSAAWLGVDRNAWVKTFSYQASVYCLLQAANEVSSRENNRDDDLNVFVLHHLLKA